MRCTPCASHPAIDSPHIHATARSVHDLQSLPITSQSTARYPDQSVYVRSVTSSRTHTVSYIRSDKVGLGAEHVRTDTPRVTRLRSPSHTRVTGWYAKPPLADGCRRVASGRAVPRCASPPPEPAHLHCTVHPAVPPHRPGMDHPVSSASRSTPSASPIEADPLSWSVIRTLW